MEDELAASITLQGAVWGGAKAFTVTSGPGFSLMMEHIGYAAMTETLAYSWMCNAEARPPACPHCPRKPT